MLPRQVLTLRLFSSNPPPHDHCGCFAPRQKLTCTYGRTQHVFSGSEVQRRRSRTALFPGNYSAEVEGEGAEERGGVQINFSS